MTVAAPLRYLLVANAPTASLATKAIRFFCTPPAPLPATPAIAAAWNTIIGPAFSEAVFLDLQSPATFHVLPEAKMPLSLAASTVRGFQWADYVFQCGAGVCDAELSCGADCAVTVQCPSTVTAASANGMPVIVCLLYTSDAADE